MAPALVAAKLADGSPTHWLTAPGDDSLAPGKAVAYGFGWFPRSALGSYARMCHSGTTTGFRSAIEWFPQDDVTVIVRANRSGLDATPRKRLHQSQSNVG